MSVRWLCLAALAALAASAAGCGGVGGAGASETAGNQLARLVSILTPYPNLRVTVEGHSDSPSTTQSARRAESVRQMVIARQGEEIVRPKGTLCGRIIRDAEDRITDDDFSTAESDATPAGDRYVCSCCGRIVAMREDQRWRVYLRRGWVR